jgi:chemotaxis protein methyltransferase CheR
LYPNPPDPIDAPARVESVTPSGYAYLQRLLVEATGIVLDAGKEYLVEARLHALMQSEGFSSVGSLLDALRLDEKPGSLHRRAVEAMLNGETSFFRDHYPFEALRTTILPDLMAKRASARTLNFWCAAVASGQEAYSLAMLLLEQVPSLRDWNLTLLATDVSESMLQRARAGAYRQIEVNRGLPAPYLVKYFERAGEEYRVKERVRQMVRFSQLNLVGPWPALPPLDVILMRNVLLYFSSETRRTIMQSVLKSLRSDGTMIVGGGETSLALDRTFEPVRIGKAVCYRIRGDRGDAAPDTGMIPA